MITFTIDKGDNFSNPRKPFSPFFKRELEGEFRFLDESRYNLKNTNQLDWNKLTGISFVDWSFKLNKNATLLAWRYDPAANIFEAAPYFNANYEKIFPNIHQIIRFSPEDMGIYRIKHNWIYIQNTNTKQEVMMTHPIKTSHFTWRIQPHFGGDDVAPNEIKLQLGWK